jgi:hypothetical protein
MPQPLPVDAHIDHYLTNLSVMFTQDPAKFVANKVFPTVPVLKQSDKYMIYPKGYFFRDEMGPRPLGDKASRAGYKIQPGTYLCEEDALSHAIDDRLRANADQPLNPDIAGQEFLSTQAMIHLDRVWAADYFKTGVWGSDQTGVASAPSTNQFLQFDQSGSKPIQVFRAQASLQASKTGYRPNKLVLGNDVFDILAEHPDIVDRIKYTQRGVLTEELLAELFHVDQVIIAGGVQNTAAEGQTDAISWIVNSKAALLTYAAPNPAINAPSAGYTFAWTGLIAGVDNALGGVIARYRDDEAHSDILEIRTAYDTNIVASELGTFFAAAVA